MLFMAIASHKLISGLALSSRFLKEGATTRQVCPAGHMSAVKYLYITNQVQHKI